MTTITLTVTAYNGRPTDGALRASFDETGGTIGRADTNQLVLPDPERAISRVHAQVVFRNGHYALIDRGSNPVQVNGRASVSGTEMPLRDGDRIAIEGYEITVRAGAAAARPVAATGPFGVQAGAPAAGAAHAAADPFGGLLGAPAVGAAADPFADLLGPAPARAAVPGGAPALPDPLAVPAPWPVPAAGRSPAAAAPPSAAWSDDWNPFAPGAPAAPPPSPLGLNLGASPSAAPFGSGHPGSGALGGADLGGADASLDELFGLQPGGATGADPLALSALAPAAALPNTAAHDDPLRALSSALVQSHDSQADAGSDLNLPFRPPPVAAPRAPAAAAEGAGGVVLSWGGAQAEGHTVIRVGAAALPVAAPVVPPVAPPVVQQVAPLAAPLTAPLMAPLVAPPVARPAAPPPAAAAASAFNPGSAAHAAPSDDVTALTQALIEGLNTPGLAVEPLTPERMRLIGALLREAAAGTVDMLLSRATLKRELKAEATTIRARENNPLKFSPSAEVALQHLLSPPARGFIAGGPALRDAYIDLRAHQFGMVAGMRAALEGVLDRFNPQTLEGRLTQPSALQSLLPGSRKARLWDVFVEHFDQIREEASDDFHTLFGEAFVRAYEAHTDQLDRERP